MLLSLKTLDNLVTQLDVTQDEPVRNIIEHIKEEWGNENAYRLIYGGKVLKDGNLLSEYGVTGTLPVIVLVTKPKISTKKVITTKAQNMQI